MDILPSHSLERAPDRADAVVAPLPATEPVSPEPQPAAELPVAAPAAYAPAYATPAGYAAPPTYGLPAEYQPQTAPQPVFPSAFERAPAATAKKGWPKRAKVAIGIVGGVIVLAIAALVAMPHFVNHTPPAVTLSLPSPLQGSTPLTTAAAKQAVAQLESTVQANIAFTNPRAAIYERDGSPTFGILAAKLTRIPTAADETLFLKGVSTGGSAPMSLVSSGPLGGSTECGVETTNGIQVAMCASIDKSAVVLVIVYSGDLTTDTALAQKLRLAVEHH
jgi:hypothetical protein